jgi:hypothetical protein
VKEGQGSVLGNRYLREVVERGGRGEGEAHAGDQVTLSIEEALVISVEAMK